MNNLSLSNDSWINEYREGNPIWIANLASGITVYRDDGRWTDGHWSAWRRLYDYCITNNDYIVSLRYGFRSNMFNLLDNQEGYFFSLASRGYPGATKKTTKQLWKLGILVNNVVRITNFYVPEFLLTDEPYESRPINECNYYSLIKK